MEPNTREANLQRFVEWTRDHIKGDEKGEAQNFVDHLFRGFGQKGAQDVGGVFEERIKSLFDDTKKTSFADYVWKPVVLIEMKKRGADLAKHRQQAFDYWTHIAPGRPQYVILCNFDEFWVYDFNTQLYTPKDKVALVDLPRRWGPLGFLFPTNEAPTFGNDTEDVTRQAADKLATCFRKLIVRKVDRDLAQRFVLQSMIAMFAEDIGLLPRYLFSNLVKECEKPEDSYDLLGGLFEAMNTEGGVTGGRYKGVRYFNGGIFAKPARVELYPDELAQLRGNEEAGLYGATQSDWSKVSPEIFGTIFQHSMDAEDRHAFGAHYTSPTDIMRIVKPTITDPWTHAIAEARTGERLNELLDRLATLRVLDPACGSGNFLYLAYREMKQLEVKIRDRLSKDFPKSPVHFTHVTARQFYGMDVNTFAIDLAKVTLMLARKLAIDELHIGDEDDLPLINLDANFKAVDALITFEFQGTDSAIEPDETPVRRVIHSRVPTRTPWPQTDVIIGNPPFLGAKRLKPERGADYVNALRKLYPEVPGMADYCVYWIARANDHLPECTAADLFIGRAGLVGTQNIRNNQSRVGGLDRVVATGTIIEAVDDQQWSGEAVVHVSIANWMKSQDTAVVPKLKRLWKADATKGSQGRSSKSGGNEPVARSVNSLNAALTDQTDVTGAAILQSVQKPQKAYRGLEPGNMGFVVPASAAAEMIAADGANRDVIHPYITGDELLDGISTPQRWVIDFQRMDQIAAQRYRAPFEHVKKTVLPQMERLSNGEDSETANDAFAKRAKKRNLVARLDTWWQLRRSVPSTIQALSSIPRYVACSRVTKRAIFAFLISGTRPAETVTSFALSDDFRFRHPSG